MHLGHEFVQLEIFLHDILRRFKWDFHIPNEKSGYDPMCDTI